MSERFTYNRGDELPGLTLPWQEESAQDTWTDLDLSNGYTFTVTLVAADGTTALTKTTNITGAIGSIAIAWAVDDLDQTPGKYTLNAVAREIATSKDRSFSPGKPIEIRII